MDRQHIAVAVPARNEAQEIAACLTALAAQTLLPGAAVLCLNNCTDDTASVVRHTAPALPFAVEMVEVTLTGAASCAGAARRIAMDRAAARVGARGTILTTDADARPEPDWIAANLAAIAGGADAVAGVAEIEPEGAQRIPAHLHEADARECRYAARLDEIAARLDPDPADPWPRHDQHSGASIAVTAAAYVRAGGMPPAALAEDRAFFTALRRIDARIRHAPEARVIVSARIQGRAHGGMADTIRRRIAHPDMFLDDRLEPARDAARRAWLRARTRSLWAAQQPIPSVLAMRLGIAETDVGMLCGQRWFGTAWAELESRSTWLSRRLPVAVAELPVEMARAARLLRGLTPARDRADIPAAESAELA